MKFGFELECRTNASLVLANLYRQGHAIDSQFHSYHCRCDICDYNGSHLFFGQNDCTVDGEIISTILDYGSPRHRRAVNAVSAAMIAANASTAGDTGLHVHVGHGYHSHRGATHAPKHDRLMRLFAVYAEQLREIAAGGHSEVRGYNSAPYGVSAAITRGDVPDTGSWLVTKSNTYEFRLWNATRAAWRINTCIGLSVAMVRAARHGADVIARDPRPIEAVLAPWLDEATWAGILRQRFLKGGIAA